MERGGMFAAVLAACATSLASALAVEGHVSQAKHAGDKKISPALEPTSHKHFFNSDYPTDLTPIKRNDGFDDPFPMVQDSEEYDKDFVKDENSDDGEWKYQSEYDRLRGKLAQAEADSKRALELEAKKSKELNAAKAAEQAEKEKAKKALEEHKAKEKEAEAKLKEAEKDLDKVGGGAGGGGVEGATKEVETEVKGLKDCEKQLEEARAKLKALQEERAKAEEAEMESWEAAQAAEEAQVARMKAEEEMEGKVGKEADDYKKAHQAYLHETKSLAELEKDFKKAEDKLRKFRHSGVDPDGGVYYDEPKKSGASVATPFAVLSALAAIAIGNAMA